MIAKLPTHGIVNSKLLNPYPAELPKALEIILLDTRLKSVENYSRLAALTFHARFDTNLRRISFE